MSTGKGMAEEGTASCSTLERTRVENSGADLLLSLAERAAEHAASPSSSVRSTPSTPPPSRTAHTQATRRAVSAERPSTINVTDHGKRLAPADSESDRLPLPKRSRMSDEQNSGKMVDEEAGAKGGEDEAANSSEQKRIISPVDPKPEDDTSEDEEKASKEYHSKAHGFGMFHGPPHCLFPPPNGRASYPPMPYGAAFPFPHAFYPAPYPYGMMHGPPHHMMYPSPYMQQPTARFPASSPAARTSPSSKTASPKPKPVKTTSQPTPTAKPSPKHFRTLPKKEQKKDEEDAWQETEQSGGDVKNLNRCVPRKYLYPPVDWR